mgnify:CR=1 FL=1
MLPLPLPGIALAGRLLLSRYNNGSLPGKNKSNYRLRPQTKPVSRKSVPMKNPIQSLVDGLTSTLSQITQKAVGEDYTRVVRDFIPREATLLAPQFPTKSQSIQFADLDGDSENEMITSYRSGNEVKTLILKKQNGFWGKISEISHSQHDTLHYRSFIDAKGAGKKYMLMGMTSKERASTLYGYAMENNGVRELFARNYHRFEVLNSPQNRDASAKVQLAIWNQKDFGSHDVEVLNWNGLQLEEVENSSAYYSRNVVPYYVRRVKKSPNISTHWYNLADALVKAGAHKDALVAIDVGMGQNRDSSLSEKFEALRNKINTK